MILIAKRDLVPQCEGMKRQGFHATDFLGSAGPGLAKLRAAQARGDIAAPAAIRKAAGLDSVKAAMLAGRWPQAILAAAKFPDLGDQAAAIQAGREAILRASFQRQLKRDPEALIEAAKAALLERWPI